MSSEEKIEDLTNTNTNLIAIIKSLKEDNRSLVEQSFIQFRNEIITRNNTN